MVDAASASIKLQRIVLSWDYWDLVRRAEEGGGPFENLREIPRTFRDVKEYKEVFEPLLLEEYCAQMLRGVEEGDVYMPHPAVVSKTEQVDDFLHCRLALQPGASEHFVDNDLVLLCKNNPMEEVAGGEGGGLAGSGAQELHALGFCLGAEGEQSVRVKFRLGDESQLSNAAGLVRVRAMRAALLEPASCWWLLKLSNTATITREWVALQYAHACPFADIMLNCKPRAAPSSRHMDIPSGMKTAMEAECNTSQMEALCAGLDGTPLVLIQGPPGTGKTRTILNLLSVVMHAAQKGSLELMKGQPRVNGSGGAVMEDEERLRMWLSQAPWVLGDPSPLDQVTPFDEPGQQGDCFGLVRKVQPAKVGQASGPRAHVLVCAPSNSALDEIVLRILKSGLMDKDGAMYTPSLVRIGVNAHHSVRPVFLDTLVEARLGSDTGGKGGTGAGTISRVERDRIKLAILEEASVVCSTLSFAGSSLLQRVSRRFDVVVIDEAAQAVEPSTLVPLVMGCRQVYLVGDPVQLPATVMSSRAKEAAYDCSLFKRLQSGGYPVRVLDTQYRMNPAISAFPSRQFYNGKLLDGESVVKETMSAWHAQPVFGPLAFFDVAGRESIPANGASIQNKAEANMVLCIYRELVHRYPVLRKTASVAVISPYKAQVKLLRDSFAAALGEEAAKLVDVNTIDGFQGREKDICIFSCVRALRKGSSSIGFVSDERRINVGLTRARCSLLVVGNTRALQRSPHWAALIHDCLQNGCMYRPKAPFADWMTAATSTGAQPVKPTAKELGLLNKARSKLSATKEVEAVTSLQVAVAVAAASDGGDAQGAAEVGALPDQLQRRRLNLRRSCTRRTWMPLTRATSMPCSGSGRRAKLRAGGWPRRWQLLNRKLRRVVAGPGGTGR
ncbi:AAA domain-containing protein [Haematococcus lacustris]